MRTNALEGVAHKPLLHLVDGGITKEGNSRHNFASIPALWRDVDILIMCDSIRHPNSDHNSEHLQAADEEARRQRLAFPDISRSSKHNKVLKTMHKDVASVFIEKNAPTVVYIKAKQNQLYDEHLAAQDSRYKRGFDPDISKARFTNTLNFSYTPEQFEVLSGLTKSILIQSKDAIKKAIHRSVSKD